MAKLNIDQIMDLFISDPEWGFSKVEMPDARLLEECKRDFSLPEDYVKLLSYADGFVLFHAGDYRMSNINWIKECKYNKKYRSGYREEILDIGYFMEYNLLLDITKSHTQSYLFAGMSIPGDEYVCVGTVTDFFNGLIPQRISDGFGGYEVNIPFWETENCEIFNFLE